MRYSTFIINKKHKLSKKHIKNLLFVSTIIIILIPIWTLFIKDMLIKADYTYYISEKGNDDNIGSKDSPLKSLDGFKSLLIKDIDNKKITK